MGRNTSFELTEVLSQAMSLFWRLGYASTSMRLIEEVTGLNPGSLYHHFSNKKGLYKAVVEYYYTSILQPRLHHYRQSASPRDGLRLFFTTSYRHFPAKEYRGHCLLLLAILEAEHECSLTPLFETYIAELKYNFSAILNQDSDLTDPDFSADYLFECYLSLQFYACLNPSRKFLDSKVRLFFERLALLNG
jgi:AcrR family transcriptional regulator